MLLTLLRRRLDRRRRARRCRCRRRRGAVKGDHDDLHKGLDRDVAGGCGRTLLLGFGGRVDAHVASQFVRAREALLAGRERALMGALSGVGPDMTGLMLETVERLWADVAFVWARRILATPGDSSRGGLLLLGCSGCWGHGHDGHVHFVTVVVVDNIGGVGERQERVGS